MCEFQQCLLFVVKFLSQLCFQISGGLKEILKFCYEISYNSTRNCNLEINIALFVALLLFIWFLTRSLTINKSKHFVFSLLQNVSTLRTCSQIAKNYCTHYFWSLLNGNSIKLSPPPTVNGLMTFSRQKHKLLLCRRKSKSGCYSRR